MEGMIGGDEGTVRSGGGFMGVGGLCGRSVDIKVGVWRKREK